HTRFSRDWSSDVCSSDLLVAARAARPFGLLEPYPVVARINSVEPRVGALDGLEVLLVGRQLFFGADDVVDAALDRARLRAQSGQIGRASCRERGWLCVDV